MPGKFTGILSREKPSAERPFASCGHNSHPVILFNREIQGLGARVAQST